LVHKAFTPRVIERLRAHIQEIVDQLLDRVAAVGRMEVVQDLAYLLPVTVIAELMGVPPEDRDRFKFWSGRIVEFMATPRPTPEVMLRSQNALLELREYFRRIFAERRQAPREDLISALVRVEEAGDKLTEEELLSTCVTILIGGHETTTNLIASGLLALLQHVDELEKLKANPDLIGPAVEEFLRYEGPFQRNRRIATRDISLDGQEIKKGDLVVQFLGAANRDPAQFSDPDRLDIERSPNKHVAFGYGVHFCLGAALARLEAPVAINTVLRRMPNLQLAADTFEWQNTVFRGLKALPVKF
jgi:cytochrome P450